MSAIVSYSSIGVSELDSDLTEQPLSWSPQIQAAASFLNEAGKLVLELKSETATIFKANLIGDIEFMKAGPCRQICTVLNPRKAESRTFCLTFASDKESKGFLEDVKAWKKTGEEVHGVTGPPDIGRKALEGEGCDSKSKFECKIESASAKMYFHYYGQLLHQQNMLQDYVRTGSYFAAVVENRVDFEGRVVVDVGAGSGILSLFAAQAGAKHVYAIEASPMAEYAKKLIKGNPILGERITVIHGKVEEVQLPEKADVLISEPMGTLLVNERMLESYVIARDSFMKKGGKMFPALGRIHLAPFSDEYLYVEIANKALFWQQHNFYGVDLTPLQSSAFQGFFSQPVVDAFDPRLLLSSSIFHTIDFTSIQEEELYDIDIPLAFTATIPARLHGLACWFDVLFDGSNVQRWLSTGPGAPTTHWYQLRLVLSQPLHVLPGQQITGRLHLSAHSNQSYNITVTLSTMSWPGVGGVSIPIQTSSAQMDLKEPYYRMSSVVSSSSYAGSGTTTQQQQTQPQPQPEQAQQPAQVQVTVPAAATGTGTGMGMGMGMGPSDAPPPSPSWATMAVNTPPTTTTTAAAAPGPATMATAVAAAAATTTTTTRATAAPAALAWQQQLPASPFEDHQLHLHHHHHHHQQQQQQQQHHHQSSSGYAQALEDTHHHHHHGGVSAGNVVGHQIVMSHGNGHGHGYSMSMPMGNQQ